MKPEDLYCHKKPALACQERVWHCLENRQEERNESDRIFNEISAQERCHDEVSSRRCGNDVGTLPVLTLRYEVVGFRRFTIARSYCKQIEANVDRYVCLPADWYLS